MSWIMAVLLHAHTRVFMYMSANIMVLLCWGKWRETARSAVYHIKVCQKTFIYTHMRARPHTGGRGREGERQRDYKFLIFFSQQWGMTGVVTLVPRGQNSEDTWLLKMCAWVFSVSLFIYHTYTLLFCIKTKSGLRHNTSFNLWPFGNCFVCLSLSHV